jgi:hypothetical protein
MLITYLHGISDGFFSMHPGVGHIAVGIQGSGSTKSDEDPGHAKNLHRTDIFHRKTMGQ